MEANEKELKEDKINLINEQLNIFKFDYENQNIENNRDFKIWKDKMKKINKDKIRINKCNDDKICFYVKINNNFNEYSDFCPICKKEICCFCYQYLGSQLNFSRYLRRYCCLKRFIYFIFFREDFLDNYYPLIVFILAYIAFIIPFINCLGIILSIIQSLFCHKKTKNNEYYSYHNYSYQTENKYYFYIVFFNVCFSFCLSICFLSLTLPFMIISFLMSIPFKMTTLTNLIFYISENAANQD